MKRFFTKDSESYTEVGNNVALEIEVELKKVFDKWIAKGYSIREIGLIAHGATEAVCCEKVIRTSMAKRKAKQDACAHENQKMSGTYHLCPDCRKHWKD